jgi:hypothetical protein
VTRFGKSATPTSTTWQAIIVQDERNACPMRLLNAARGIFATASTLSTTTPAAQGALSKFGFAAGINISVAIVVSVHNTR